MKIRTLQSADYPQVLAMIQQLHAIHVKHRPDIFGDTSEALPKEEFQARLLDENILSVVAEREDGALLGVCLAEWRERTSDDPRWKGEKFAYIKDLYVQETCRKGGIGHTLMEEVSRRAQNAGADCVELQVVLMPDGAFDFYQKIGFAPKTCSMRYQFKKKGERDNDTI